MASTDRFKVVILDIAPGKHFQSPDIERNVLDDVADVELIRTNLPREIVGRVENANAIIVWNRFELLSGLIAELRQCHGIVCASVGFNHLDIDLAAKRGIPVCNVPDYGTEEVADHTLALMLSLVRKLHRFDESVRRGVWDWKEGGSILRLRGAKCGIVGFGRIGAAVARRVLAFGMEVMFYDPYVPDGVDKSHGVSRCERLHALLDECQIISLHVPLTEQTRHLIGEEELQRLTSDKILINTARGGIIDEAALIEKVKSGSIGAVGLDVLNDEPHVPSLLQEADSVLISPHSAWYSDASLAENRRKSATAAKNLLLGLPVRTVVNGICRGLVQ